MWGRSHSGVAQGSILMPQPSGISPRISRVAWVIAAAVCSWIGIWGPASAAEIGAAVVVVNHVTGALGAQKAPVVWHAGIDVFQDEVVRSADDSAARVVFQDKTTLEVAPKSEVVLDKFVFDPDPSLSKVTVSIVAGVARFTTGNLPKDDYKILTPGGSVAVRGTVLDFHVDAGGGTFVFCEEGTGLFTAGGHTVTLHAGQSSFAQVGSTPSPPANTPFPTGLLNQMFALLQQTAAGNGASTNPPGTGPLYYPSTPPPNNTQCASDCR